MKNIELNLDSTEKRTPKTYKIEPSIYNAAAAILKNENVTISSWIRDQVAELVNRKDNKNG